MTLDSTATLKHDLLALIPARRFGAPATNVSIAPRAVHLIEKTASRLEAFSPYASALASNPAAVERLDGAWRLLYTDASEITRLEKLPLGFRLGAVFQPIDAARGRLENQAFVEHRFLAASAHTRVLAGFEFEQDASAVNRAGVANGALARVNVKFEKVAFSLRRVLFLPVFGLLRKTAIPKGPAEKQGVIPSIDVTYLDDDLRISRGGDGSLFVLTRFIAGSGSRPRPFPPIVDTEKLKVRDGANTYNAATDILPAGSHPAERSS